MQEYCDMDEKKKKNRKFTYFVRKNDFVFVLYLFGKINNIFAELKAFDKLHEKYKLKEHGWSKF